MAAATKRSAKDLFGSLNPNTTLVVIWVLVVIALLGGYFFLLYQPLTEERTAEDQRKTQLTTQRQTEEANLRRYNSNVADLARARAHALDLQTVLPNDADIPGFMRNINSLAEASGLQIALIQPVEERAEQYYARIPVQLQVRGTFLALARFFHAVSQLPRVINMENIKLRNPTVDPVSNDVRLEASVLATTFRSLAPGQGGVHAAGTPGAAGANAATVQQGGTR